MVKLAVLISGSGTNLQALINAIKNDGLNAEICCVISDNPKAFGLKRAAFVNIPTHVVKRGKGLSKAILPLVEEADYIVLAGFLSILSADFCKKWSRKIINLHPALLPKYGGKGMYGDFVHQAVLNNNEKESGATVHWVTEEIDRGDIITQDSCTVSPNDTVESLAKKVHEIEHRILVEAIRKLTEKTSE
ncbi:phosphoribosylglycinamide formyltransferase-1 [Balneicella halophila]|uniref:Phosphoribosylglycinamide formyltransferase n=1 Tax=Balneicella halophila TaxID=1537566 RepID=A0A7L4URH4_BALHA|nr:phosphoribosylglycinamide formyltransferase [Balneicella halophila]PVX52375.1 phosphoribosylglycinamide formyltransferase-1 [Balneicella halophila]